MYQEVCFNGGSEEGEVNVGHSLRPPPPPPSHFMLATGLYHTNLGQNAVFHNFALQIALIQYSGQSNHANVFGETVKKISKITYTASRFSLFTSTKVDCLN